jgi:hypothetical protein
LRAADAFHGVEDVPRVVERHSSAGRDALLEEYAMTRRTRLFRESFRAARAFGIDTTASPAARRRAMERFVRSLSA